MQILIISVFHCLCIVLDTSSFYGYQDKVKGIIKPILYILDDRINLFFGIYVFN